MASSITSFDKAVRLITSIPVLDGSPNGVIKAPPGQLVVTTTGYMYIKTTAETSSSGWKIIIAI